MSWKNIEIISFQAIEKERIHLDPRENLNQIYCHNSRSVFQICLPLNVPLFCFPADRLPPCFRKEGYQQALCLTSNRILSQRGLLRALITRLKPLGKGSERLTAVWMPPQSLFNQGWQPQEEVAMTEFALERYTHVDTNMAASVQATWLVWGRNISKNRNSSQKKGRVLADQTSPGVHRAPGYKRHVYVSSHFICSSLCSWKSAEYL